MTIRVPRRPLRGRQITSHRVHELDQLLPSTQPFPQLSLSTMSSPLAPRVIRRTWIADTKPIPQPRDPIPDNQGSTDLDADDEHSDGAGEEEGDATSSAEESFGQPSLNITDVESVADSLWDSNPRPRGRFRFVGSDVEYETDGEPTPRHVCPIPILTNYIHG